MFVEASILTALLLGLLLGIRHALDIDHVVAVTTIVSRSRHTLRSALAGVTWGVGHSIVLLAAGFAVLVLRLTIPDRLALFVEFAVGVMLVVLGVPLLWRLRKVHTHVHRHEGEVHLHPHSHADSRGHEHIHLRKPLLVGMIHGLAGSGALTLLALGAMPSILQGLLFLLLFGVGSILGMMVFGGLISLPFKLTAGFSLRLNLWFQGVAGLVSVALGLLIIWQTGVAGDLFHFTS